MFTCICYFDGPHFIMFLVDGKIIFLIKKINFAKFKELLRFFSMIYDFVVGYFYLCDLIL